MAIKKAFTELHTLLATASKGKKIDPAIFDQAVVLMSAKGSSGSGATTYLKDASGKPVAQKCYYFQRWMPLVGDKAVEFGKKANTATGLNTMSKVGAKLWTKQYNVAKKAKVELIDLVAAEKFAPKDLNAAMAKIDEDRAAIAETKDGFAKLEEVKAYLVKSGVKLVDAPAK